MSQLPRFVLVTLSVPLVLLVQSTVRGQTIIASSSAPVSSGRVVVASGGAIVTGTAIASAGAVCPKCGRIHGATGNFVPTPSTGGQLAQRTGSGTSNVLSTLNAQRSRRGLGTLTYDPSLQAVAERRARQMAASGMKGHPPGSFSPGRYEGVGWSSSYSPSGVSACFTNDPRMRAAGAAMATGRDGVYFCVVYR